MRKFWKIIGKIYLFISPRKHLLIPVVVVVLILLHFTFSIWVIVKINKMEDEVAITKTDVVSSVDRMYSQLYLMNNRINSLK